ncbi:MAG TPA: hypothetical protein VF538_11370 [Pyrinomonadaceae bacterium]|jgi:hypothetical protein
MRQKIKVAILAAVISLAGASEAIRQFDSLKTSVNDWTRTSILGSLLVYAADGAQSPARAAQPTVLLAHASASPCAGGSTTSAARESRPASRNRVAADDHAAERRVLDETAMSFAATPRAPKVWKAREEFVSEFTPDIADAAKSAGAGAGEREAAQAVRVREGVEAGAARARVAAELKKLGLRRVFVRVAQVEGSGLPAAAFELRLPEPAPPAPAAKPRAGLGDEAPAAHDAPAEATGFAALFSTPAPSVSLNCDSDPRR